VTSAVRRDTTPPLKRLIGLRHLVHDLVEKTTNLVQEQHFAVVNKPTRLLDAVAPRLGDVARVVESTQRLTASVVYDAIRATNAGVRVLGDVGLDAAATSDDAEDFATPLRSTALGSRSWWVDHAQGALNGVMGDFLYERDNDLHIQMGIRVHGRSVPADRSAMAAALPGATGRIVVFVHGLMCTEWSWSFDADKRYGDPDVNFGTLLARDLGFTPLYVRYNTGLHISENGRSLSALLDAVFAAYPLPIEQIVIVGHSMGGLVSRSAAHYGHEHGASWTKRLTHVYCIGSPNLGAPLEKTGNVLAAVLGYFDTPGTQVPAALLKARSAGIKDLRFGYVVDEDWKDRDPDALLEDNRNDVPFVDSVLYCFVAGTLTRNPSHPATQLLGDVLVRMPSASGRAPDAARRIPFHVGGVVSGAHHVELANHPDVYAEIRRWLVDAPAGLAP
jgi:pimeloyl-ACP methyl ester carboxylesterase